MNRSDIATICVVYATCLFFLGMTLELKSAAQIYPLCLIIGLGILNTLYLAKCVIKAARARGDGGEAIHNDLPTIFSGFMARQFFFVAIACVLYMFLLHYIGFYPAGLVYLVAVMAWLKVRPLAMAVTVVLLGCLVYCVFTLFLKVPLPAGTLFSLGLGSLAMC